MPIYLRLFYLNQLSEAKEKEQEAMEASRKGSGKTPGSIPKGIPRKPGKVSSKGSVPRFSGPKTKK
jgi:hypothetical protein